MDTDDPPQRPFRRGICDGDDVWPATFTDEDLQIIAAIDSETKKRERKPPPMLMEFFGDGPVWSLAELVRTWKDLVEDTETGSHLHPHEYVSRLETRELLEGKLDQLSDSLRGKLTTELLDPLDTRFKVATTDDGGLALGREVNLNQIDRRLRWWQRRPTNLGPLWERSGQG